MKTNQARFTPHAIEDNGFDIYGYMIHDELGVKSKLISIPKIHKVDSLNDPHHSIQHLASRRLCYLLNTGRRTLDDLEDPFTEKEMILTDLGFALKRVDSFNKRIDNSFNGRDKAWEEVTALRAKLVGLDGTDDVP